MAKKVAGFADKLAKEAKKREMGDKSAVKLVELYKNEDTNSYKFKESIVLIEKNDDSELIK